MTKQDLLKAQFVMIAGLLAIAFIFNLPVLFKIALVLALLFLLSEKTGEFIVKQWFKLAEILGWINSRILLSIIYFLILLPTALLRKLFSKKSILILDDKSTSTFFVERNHLYTKKDLEKPW